MGSQTRPWSPRPCKALFLASHVLQVMDVTTLFQQRLNTIPLLEDGKLIQYTRSNGDISFSFLFFFFFLLPKPLLVCEELLNFYTVTMRCSKAPL